MEKLQTYSLILLVLLVAIQAIALAVNYRLAVRGEEANNAARRSLDHILQRLISLEATAQATAPGIARSTEDTIKHLVETNSLLRATSVSIGDAAKGQVDSTNLLRNLSKAVEDGFRDARMELRVIAQKVHTGTELTGEAASALQQTVKSLGQLQARGAEIASAIGQSTDPKESIGERLLRVAAEVSSLRRELAEAVRF